MKELIELEEYEQSSVVCLTKIEVNILKTQYSKRIGIIEISENNYRIKAHQYVGTIVLVNHIIRIKPKIKPYANFFFMLFYVHGIFPFMPREAKYEKYADVLQILLSYYVNSIASLVKQGLQKGYIDEEDNLRKLRGRVLIKENIKRNIINIERIYCTYSEFIPDTTENRIIKYTLYHILPLVEKELSHRIRGLLHYFESVTLEPFSIKSFPRLWYSRLNVMYRPLMLLSKIILEESSIDFQKTGEINFASFLVNMNWLFEKFILGYLKANLKYYLKAESKDYSISGSTLYPQRSLDVEGKIKENPDILIRRNGVPIIVIDAKYKRLSFDEDEGGYIIHSDINQINTYFKAFNLQLGVLFYPEELTNIEEKHTIIETHELIYIKTIKINSDEHKDFIHECNKFVEFIHERIKDIKYPIIVNS